MPKVSLRSSTRKYQPVRYKVYKEQINKPERQIDRHMELKAALYEDYAEGTITAEDYVAMGQNMHKN